MQVDNLVRDTSSPAALGGQGQRGWPGWLSAGLLAAAGVAHLPLIPAHLRQAPYLGVLFVAFALACLALAVALALKPTPLRYLFCAILGTAGVCAYAATRLVAFPQLAHEVGNWLEPLGVVSIVAEAAAAVISIITLRRLTSHDHRIAIGSSDSDDGLPADADLLPGAGMPWSQWRWRLSAALLAVGLGAAVLTGGVMAWQSRQAPGQTSPEVGFSRDMYVHHTQAVQMSLAMLRKSRDSQIVSMAEEVITGQAEQQGRLVAWLDGRHVPAPDASWQSMAWMNTPAGDKAMAGMHGDQSGPPATGADRQSAPETSGEMPGMASPAQLAQLDRATGRTAEVLFLQLMTRHHKGGVEMAQAFLDRSDDPTLSAIANGIVTSQQFELNLMARLLEERGATT